MYVLINEKPKIIQFFQNFDPFSDLRTVTPSAKRPVQKDIDFLLDLDMSPNIEISEGGNSKVDMSVFLPKEPDAFQFVTDVVKQHKPNKS